MKGNFQQHLHCVCAETAIYKFPIKFLTPAFHSLTPLPLDFFICLKSAIGLFLLPVCSTYWPRKFIKPIHALIPTVIISTKFEADMTVWLTVLLQIRFVSSRPWLLTFWPWTVVIHGPSCDPMPIRSWVHLWIVTSSIGHHWKCVYAATAHAPNHATSKYGSKNWLHFWNARPQYLLIHCTTFIGLRRLRVV